MGAEVFPPSLLREWGEMCVYVCVCVKYTYSKPIHIFMMSILVGNT